MPVQELLTLALKALNRNTVRLSTRTDEDLRDAAIVAIEEYLKSIEPESVETPEVKRIVRLPVLP